MVVWKYKSCRGKVWKHSFSLIQQHKMKSFLALVCFAGLVSFTNAQCPAGSSETGPCIGACPNPADTCVNNAICCGVIPTVATTAASTVSVATVTASPGCIGREWWWTCFMTNWKLSACFDNECPAGYTCNTVSQECCLSTATTSSTTTCRDLVGPRGFSDCPARASLCNSTVYFDLMTQQCPRTCGRCSNSTSTNTTGSTNCKAFLLRPNPTVPHLFQALISLVLTASPTVPPSPIFVTIRSIGRSWHSNAPELADVVPADKLCPTIFVKPWVSKH